MRHDLLAVSALLTSVVTLTAQTATDTHTSTAPAAPLPDMVVTSTRAEEATQRIPAHVTVIDGEALRASGYRTVAEALQAQPGIIMRATSGTPATAEISMRGFGENAHGRVLVLIDGIRLNRPDLATINWMQFPISNVERIEISRGGASALYGDHAVAGVVQVFTRKPTDGAPSGEVAVSGGSFDTYTARAGLSGTEQNLAYSIDANVYSTTGYRDRSDTESVGLGTSLSYPVGSHSDMSLILSWQDVSYELPGYLTLEQMAANPRQSTNPEDDVDDTYQSGILRLKTVFHDGLIGTVDLALSRKEVRSDVASWFSYSDLSIDSLALTPRLEIHGDLLGRPQTLLVGVDAYLDMLEQTRFLDATHGFESGGADVDKSSVGVYARHETELNDSLLLALGARTEWATIDAKAWSDGATTVDDSVDHQESAFDLALTRLIGTDSKLFGRIASLYRYPFVDEQVSFYGWGDTIYTELEPEAGLSAEIGTQVGLADATISAALFFLEMQDEIAYNGVTFQNENIDDTRRYGAELIGRWSCGRLILGADYSYTIAEFVAGPNDGKDVPLVPTHKGSVSASLILPGGVMLDSVATYVGESYLGGDYANLGPKLDDYTVVDLFVKFHPARAEYMELYAGIQNLFDEQYASIGYKGFSNDGYYPSAGVNYQAGLRYTF